MTKVTQITVRTYYEDTDAAGVVYYANYLKYFERGRTEWLRSKGFEQAKLARQDRLAFVVKKVSVDYQKPAFLDDVLSIQTEVIDYKKGARINFKQAIVRDNQNLVEANIQIACINLDKMSPVLIPKPLATILLN